MGEDKVVLSLMTRGQMYGMGRGMVWLGGNPGVKGYERLENEVRESGLRWIALL